MDHKHETPVETLEIRSLAVDIGLMWWKAVYEVRWDSTEDACSLLFSFKEYVL